MASTLKVIDVSSWNPSVNWARVAKSVDGVIIRAGYRGTGGGLATDKMWLQFIRGAIGAGIKRIGAYWWTTHNTVAQAQADADYLSNLLRPYRDNINFGVWLDSEAPGGNSGKNGSAFLKLGAAARTTCHLAFLAAMRSAGYSAGVYASDSWFVERLILSRLADYPLWVAKYGKVPPKMVKLYAGWQYTSTGRVDGISNGVDMSHFYPGITAGGKMVEVKHDMDTLRTGDKGQQVRALQKLLGGIAVDGDFGPETRAAVEAYQRQYKLDVDGIVGPKTWAVLLE